MDNKNIKERLKAILEFKNDSVNSFAIRTGFQQRKLNRQINEDTAIGYDVISAFAEEYSDIDMNWLISGIGYMVKSKNAPQLSNQDDGDSYLLKRFEELIRENESLKRDVEDLNKALGAMPKSKSYTFKTNIGSVAEPDDNKKTR